VRRQGFPTRTVPVAALLLLAVGRLAAPAPAWAGAATLRHGHSCTARRGLRRGARQVAVRAEPQGLQGKVSLELIKAQSTAGYAMKDLGQRLEGTHFKASALDGRVNVVFDGTQQLREVEVAEDALDGAGGDREALAQALLGALQEAHDKSSEGSKGEVWQTYRENRQLMDAPLNQLGVGDTVEDLWANVTRTNETIKLAQELFDKFDEDMDGYWNLNETSKVQMATEGTEMQEESFNALIIAAAPDGGRKLSEQDLERGLSREQVIELYTDAQRQRQLGFVLDVAKDHAKIFGQAGATGEAGAAEASGGDAPTPASTAPVVD